jgi:hypothetical protein
MKHEVNYSVTEWDIVKDTVKVLGEFGEDFEKAKKCFDEAIAKRKEQNKRLKETDHSSVNYQLKQNGLTIIDAVVRHFKKGYIK